MELGFQWPNFGSPSSCMILTMTTPWQNISNQNANQQCFETKLAKGVKWNFKKTNCSKEVAVKKGPDITFQVTDESGKCDETSEYKTINITFYDF